MLNLELNIRPLTLQELGHYKLDGVGPVDNRPYRTYVKMLSDCKVFIINIVISMGYRLEVLDKVAAALHCFTWTALFTLLMQLL